jgi:hypothetical protein
MKTLFSIFTALTLLIIPAKSQDSFQGYTEHGNSSKFGIYAGINRNSQELDNSKSFGQECCAIFKKGIGYGYDLGVFTEFLNTGPVSLGSRIGFSNTPGDFSYNEIMPAIKDGHTELINFRYNLETKVYAFSVEPFFNIALFENLSLLGGFRFSYVTGTYYKSYESIQSGNMTFPDGRKTTNIADGSIPAINKFLYSARAGLCYEIPLSSDGSVILAPELFYDYMFNSLVSGAFWKVTSFAGGLSLKFR